MNIVKHLFNIGCVYLMLLKIYSCYIIDDNIKQTYYKGNNPSIENMHKEKVTTSERNPALLFQRSYSKSADVKQNSNLYLILNSNEGRRTKLMARNDQHWGTTTTRSASDEDTDGGKVRGSPEDITHKTTDKAIQKMEASISESHLLQNSKVLEVSSPVLESHLLQNSKVLEVSSPVLESHLLQNSKVLEVSSPVLESHLLQNSKVLEVSSPVLESHLLQNSKVLEVSSPVLESHLLQNSEVLEVSSPVLESHLLQNSEVLEVSSPVLESHLLQNSEVLEVSSPVLESHLLQNSEVLEVSSPVLESHLLQNSEVLEVSSPVLESHLLQNSKVLEVSSPVLESHLLPNSEVLEVSSPVLESHLLQNSEVLEVSSPVLESHLLQNSEVLEVSSPVLESHLLQNVEVLEDKSHVSDHLLFENIETVRNRKWDTPPINYYRCGKCACYEIDSIVHSNCDNVGLQDFPNNISMNTVYLNVQHNHIPLQFNQLERYTCLLVLDMSSNNILKIENNTCNQSLILQSLNLTNNNIWTISDFSFRCLPYLKHLYLQKNNINIVRNFMLTGINHLQHLDLSWNILSRIEPTAFDSSGDLRILILSHNKLMKYSTKAINARLFKPLKRLEILRIQGFSESPEIYPTDALLELKNLKELTVDGAVSGTFQVNLTSLTNLSTVNIGVDGRCLIKNLSDGYFKGLPYLRSVHLSGCKPNHISPLAFQTNTQLEDLKYTNMAYEFDSLFESLSGLQNTSIKSLLINRVTKHSKRTACRYLSEQHAKNLKNMHHLKNLNLENNLISLVEYGFLANLPVTLEKLNIRKNTLNYLRAVVSNIGLSFLQNLTELNEDMQNRVIFLNDQELSEDSSETENVSRRIQTDSSQHALPMSSSSCASSVSENMNASPSLKYIMPKNLQFYSAVQSFNFGEHLLSKRIEKNRIRYMNISNTYITDWGSRLLPEQVEIADFSDNYCDDLKISFFRLNNSLIEFHASGNFFGDLFERDENGDILSRLGLVRYLDFSRNHLRYLPVRFFSGLVKVEVINLSNNMITSLDSTISHMKSLTFLDLSHNSISWISRESRDGLDLVNLNHNVTIDLTSNHLYCTCAGLEVLQWLTTTRVTILNKDFLECQNEDNVLALLGDLQDRFTSLQRKCVTKSLLIVITTFSLATFLLVVLSVWMFSNRWKLHYIRNIAIAKLYGYKLNKKDDGQLYKFDAYILYSDEDIRFVSRQCVNELEVKRGHKLCFEHRDFLLGSFMPCAITTAINNSRITIPVVSPDFWENEWCQYGVQIAVMEAIHTKREVLQLLVYKPVDVNNMPRNLITVLRDNNFCEYPPECCDEDVKKAFWDALSLRIGHVNPRDEDVVEIE